MCVSFQEISWNRDSAPKSVQSENISVNLVKTSSSLSVGRSHVDAAKVAAERGRSVKSLGSQAHATSPGWQCLPAPHPRRWPGSSGGKQSVLSPPPPPPSSLPPSHHPSSPSLHLLPEEVTDGPVIWFHSLDWSNTCPPPLGCKGLIPNHASSQRQIWVHMQIRQQRGSSAACSSATRRSLPTDQEHQSPLEVPTTKNH